MTTSSVGLAASSVFANSGTTSRPFTAPATCASGCCGGGALGSGGALTSAATSETEKRPAAAAASHREKDFARMVHLERGVYRCWYNDRRAKVLAEKNLTPGPLP